MKTSAIKLLLAFLLLFNTTLIFGQTNSLPEETAFMNCVYEAMPDKGAKLKELLDAAEKKLIKLKYLKNASGESYVEIYKNITSINSDELKDLGVVSYMNKLSDRIKTPEAKTCMDAIFKDPEFKNSKFAQMMMIVQKMGTYTNDSSLTADILRILNPEDFMHDYYRMTTFSMIETMNQTGSAQPSEQPQVVTDAELTAEEIKNILYIEVTDDERVLVNQKEMKVADVSERVASYLQQFEAKNVIALKGSKKASDTFLMNVQNKILQGFSIIRNKVAKEKYNRAFGEIETKLQAEIAKTYPLRIKKMNPDE